MKSWKHLIGLSVSLALILLSQQSVFAQSDVPQMSPEQQALYDQLLDMIDNRNSPVNPNTGLPQGIQEDLEIIITPNIPRPGETVNIRIESFSTNLNGATISWGENGSLVASGVGFTEFNTIAPAAGSRSVIVLTIVKQGGSTIQKEITLAPAGVDLAYEAETYTPPFYKGGPIFTSESLLRFVAIPDFISEQGSRISPQNLIYTWKVDNQVVARASGAGRDVFTYTSVLLQRPMTVSVEITSLDGLLQGRDEVGIVLQRPEVVLYEKSPLYGTLFENAVEGTFILDRPEVTLVAEPYFFNMRSLNDFLTQFYWYTNDLLVQTTSDNSVTFRIEEGQPGQASIAVTADRSRYILQNAGAEVNLDFSEAGSDFSF